MWTCPVCGGGLGAGERTYRCPEGHAYDLAREGYLNLLVTHQRKARPPGDDATMVAARRAFLDAGHYDPLVEAVAAAVPDGPTLDAGCGEGTYSRRWADPWCLDISKAAVRAAARRGPQGRYAVASAFAVPLPSGSMAAAVSVFGPVAPAELARVLAPGGLLLVAGPGPMHLAGLKAHLFDEPEPHEPPSAPAGFVETARQRLTFDVHLGPGEPSALLAMTPWWWYVSAEVKTRVAALPGLETAADVVLLSCAAEPPAA